MFDRLAVAEQRFNELNEKACDMAVISDPAQYRDVMKEIKQLTPLSLICLKISTANGSTTHPMPLLILPLTVTILQLTLSIQAEQ